MRKLSDGHLLFASFSILIKITDVFLFFYFLLLVHRVCLRCTSVDSVDLFDCSETHKVAEKYEGGFFRREVA